MQDEAGIQKATEGGVVLGGGTTPFGRMPAESRSRVRLDITAVTLLAEARNMLTRAQFLLEQDVGAEEDPEGNVEIASRIAIALKVLSGAA